MFRSCTDLQADATFVKNSCADQTNLANLAVFKLIFCYIHDQTVARGLIFIKFQASGSTARVCIFNQLGNLIQSATVPIVAYVNNYYG